ncbi:MAG: methyltransferase domain-containing protein [Myxococcales bacterium]|nr:methyltransferase domain-containing protein [Myxococcales bacterium]
MPLIVQEPFQYGMSMLLELQRIVVHRRTAFQEVIIADTEAFGRTLLLDGLVQSSIADEALYHELLIHPALVIHGAPRRVLVGGTGEGASLREILRHPTVEAVLTVDLDGEVVELCKEHLPEWSAGAFEDPRVESRIGDFLDTLSDAEPGSFDIIVSDLTDPVEDGPSVHLWSRSYYRQVARALADDGIFVLQAGELDPLDLHMARCVRSTLLEVFPHVHFVHSYVPSFHCLWAFAVASKRPFDPSPPDLEDRIARLPDSLRVYTPARHRVAIETPPYLAKMLATPGKVVTSPDEVPSILG